MIHSGIYRWSLIGITVCVGFSLFYGIIERKQYIRFESWVHVTVETTTRGQFSHTAHGCRRQENIKEYTSLEKFVSEQRRIKQGSPQCSDIHKNCPNYSVDAFRGRWCHVPHHRKHEDELDRFDRQVRERFYPRKNFSSFQRTDGVCGINVSYSEDIGFMAICEARGPRPCCYDGHCRHIPEENCVCENCFDTRTTKDAEISEWIPDNPECNPKIYTKEIFCHIFKGREFVFVGDSLIRQVYVALLQIAHDAIVPGTGDRGFTRSCSGFGSGWLGACPENITRLMPCNGTVSIRYIEIKPCCEKLPMFLKSMEDLTKRNNVYLMMNMGLHDAYNDSLVMEKYIRPVRENMEKSGREWPKMVFLSSHKMSLRKATRDRHVRPITSYDKFAASMGENLKNTRIGYLNMHRFTESVVSYDGLHFGFGLSLRKMDSILQYFENLQCSGFL